MQCTPLSQGDSRAAAADIFFRYAGGRALQKIPDRAAAAASTVDDVFATSFDANHIQTQTWLGEGALLYVSSRKN